jgi:hypothetical protein
VEKTEGARKRQGGGRKRQGGGRKKGRRKRRRKRRFRGRGLTLGGGRGAVGEERWRKTTCDFKFCVYAQHPHSHR